MVRNEQTSPGFRYLQGRIVSLRSATLPYEQQNCDAVFIWFINEIGA